MAVLGAMALLPIAWGLVQHTMSIPEAAKRASVLLIGLWLVESIVLPLLAPMLAPRDEPASLHADSGDPAGGA